MGKSRFVLTLYGIVAAIAGLTFIAIGISMLAGIGVLGHDMLVWAQTGTWRSMTIADGFAEIGPVIPNLHTGWIGIDQLINDQIALGRLWVFFFFWLPIGISAASLMLGALVKDFAKDIERKQQRIVRGG